MKWCRWNGGEVSAAFCRRPTRQSRDKTCVSRKMRVLYWLADDCCRLGCCTAGGRKVHDLYGLVMGELLSRGAERADAVRERWWRTVFGATQLEQLPLSNHWMPLTSFVISLTVSSVIWNQFAIRRESQQTQHGKWRESYSVTCPYLPSTDGSHLPPPRGGQDLLSKFADAASDTPPGVVSHQRFAAGAAPRSGRVGASLSGQNTGTAANPCSAVLFRLAGVEPAACACPDPSERPDTTNLERHHHSPTAPPRISCRYLSHLCSPPGVGFSDGTSTNRPFLVGFCPFRFETFSPTNCAIREQRLKHRDSQVRQTNIQSIELAPAASSLLYPLPPAFVVISVCHPPRTRAAESPRI
ncbi:hypothetical protein VTI74DRAFT_7666 [Chaetomium olivicolor]